MKKLMMTLMQSYSPSQQTLSTIPTTTTSMVAVSVRQQHASTMVVDTPQTTTTSMVVAQAAPRLVPVTVVE